MEYQVQELRGGGVDIRRPKSSAGRRVVDIPAVIVTDIEAHLLQFADAAPDSFVFGNGSQPLRRATLYTAWDEARRAQGLFGVHLHDMRHAGNVLAGATGASTKELMARLGHASPQAALRYQHATSERGAAIAAAMSDLIQQAGTDHSAPVRRLRRSGGSGRD